MPPLAPVVQGLQKARRCPASDSASISSAAKSRRPAGVSVSAAPSGAIALRSPPLVDRNADLPREVVVADARLAQRRLPRARSQPHAPVRKAAMSD